MTLLPPLNTFGPTPRALLRNAGKSPLCGDWLGVLQPHTAWQGPGGGRRQTAGSAQGRLGEPTRSSPSGPRERAEGRRGAEMPGCPSRNAEPLVGERLLPCPMFSCLFRGQRRNTPRSLGQGEHRNAADTRMGDDASYHLTVPPHLLLSL